MLTGPLGGSVAIPDTLQNALMARLDQLHTATEVAQLGAVLGREFSYEMLQALTPQDEATLAYWQRAGQRALQGSGYAEAVAHLRQGLAVLTALPETPELCQQELDFQWPWAQRWPRPRDKPPPRWTV